MESDVSLTTRAVEPSGSAVFLDTTIQIARFVHSPEMKLRVEERIHAYDVSVTGLVARLEFKRRLLKEADYLLRQLTRLGSYIRLRRHVDDVLPIQQQRKRNICVEILGTILEQEDDASLTDRARLFLRDLITGGLQEFDELVDSVISIAGLPCAKRGIREVRKYSKYDFGDEKCSRNRESCGIVPFLKQREPQLRSILQMIQTLPSADKTDELAEAQDFIEAYFRDPAVATVDEPCVKVGDLLIALESSGIPAFYTMNGKESQHLARVMGQELVVRPRNPKHPDVICQRGAAWPRF